MEFVIGGMFSKEFRTRRKPRNINGVSNIKIEKEEVFSNGPNSDDSNC